MKVTINQELCKACGVCGHVCPRHILETNSNGKKITTVSVVKKINCLAITR